MGQEIRHYTWYEFDEDCKKIVKKIKNNTSWNIKYVYGPPRGGLCPAVKISHLLGAKYISEITMIDGKNNILIVDDVSDTGKTLKKLLKNKFNYYTATLFIKPQTVFIPDIYIQKVNNDVWIHYPWEK